MVAAQGQESRKGVVVGGAFWNSLCDSAGGDCFLQPSASVRLLPTPFLHLPQLLPALPLNFSGSMLF